MKFLVVLCGLFLALCSSAASAEPTAASDAILYRYGTHAAQFGELRLPPGPGPFPVVVVVHGGCLIASYANATHTAPMAAALVQDGVATWNIEYRRLDNGGGWPTTYLDVAAAVDHLREIAKRHPIDLGNVVAVGHSAGAPLAAWASRRGALAPSSEIRGGNPLPIKAMVAIDGPVALARFSGEAEKVCGRPVVTQLFGGAVDAQRERYAQADPGLMPTSHVPTFLLTSVVLTPNDAGLFQRERTAKGERVVVSALTGSDHFRMTQPGSAEFWTTRALVRAAVHAP